MEPRGIGMDFNNIKLKNIVWVGHFRPKTKKWVAQNRQTHIVGVGIKGILLHKIDNQKIPISDDCVYFLNQKDNYSAEVVSLENTESFSIHFTTYEPIDTDSFHLKIKNNAEIIRLLDKIYSLYMANAYNDNLCFSHFYNLVSFCQNIRKKNYVPNDSRMMSAKEYMDAHFSEKDCLEQAQSTCNISRRHFNELFKKQFDVTPNRYIVLRKIEYAKQLLVTAPLSVSEISDACGFSDICYFSNVFKAETGYSPCKYRNTPPQL